MGWNNHDRTYAAGCLIVAISLALATYIVVSAFIVPVISRWLP